MAEQEERDYYASVSEGKGGMGDGSLCAGNASGKISERRPGQLSGVFMEVRYCYAGIDYI